MFKRFLKKGASFTRENILNAVLDKFPKEMKKGCTKLQKKKKIKPIELQESFPVVTSQHLGKSHSKKDFEKEHQRDVLFWSLSVVLKHEPTISQMRNLILFG